LEWPQDTLEQAAGMVDDTGNTLPEAPSEFTQCVYNGLKMNPDRSYKVVRNRRVVNSFMLSMITLC
jgi:hypothetical protein